MRETPYGTQTAATLDFDSYYTVNGLGLGGIAFYLIGFAEGELSENWVRAVMVGDDRVCLVEVCDLAPLDRDAFCGECGQVGCTHDGLDR